MHYGTQKYSINMGDALDGEIISIINKLNKIQKVVGGGKSSTGKSSAQLLEGINSITC